MNINTLTIKAQEALQAALSLAREQGQQAVEPLHLLATLIREDDSLSTFLLGRVGVAVRSLRDEVGRAVASLPRVEVRPMSAGEVLARGGAAAGARFSARGRPASWREDVRSPSEEGEARGGSERS